VGNFTRYPSVQPVSSDIKDLRLGELDGIYTQAASDAVNIIFPAPLDQVQEVLVGNTHGGRELGHVPREKIGLLVIEQLFLDFQIEHLVYFLCFYVLPNTLIPNYLKYVKKKIHIS